MEIKMEIFESDRGWKFKCLSRLERASRCGVYAAEGKDRCSYFLPRRRTKGARRIFCTFQYQTLAFPTERSHGNNVEREENRFENSKFEDLRSNLFPSNFPSENEVSPSRNHLLIPSILIHPSILFLFLRKEKEYPICRKTLKERQSSARNSTFNSPETFRPVIICKTVGWAIISGNVTGRQTASGDGIYLPSPLPFISR